MWSDMLSSLNDWFNNLVTWKQFFDVAFRIVFIIIIGKILLVVLKKIIVKTVARNDSKQTGETRNSRSTTVGRLINNMISYAIYFIMALMILNQLGVQIGPLLAGAGVVGIAIGFGAQSLVRDILTGFFIIFEDQFGVGDVIQTGTFKGEVEEIGLRVTTIKSFNGEVFIIPNGSILNVTNFSRNNSVQTFDIPFDHQTDIDRAIEIIRETIETIHTSIEELTKKPEVLGIQSIVAGEIFVRVQIETRANSQLPVMRKLYAAIKRSLDAEQIMISGGPKR